MPCAFIRVPFVVTYVFAMALRSAGMVLEDFFIVRQAEQARGFDPTGKSLAYKIRKYIMYMIPLFALSLRRSEEFTNALVARGYAFTGEAAKVKRADFVLTHYSFKTTGSASSPRPSAFCLYLSSSCVLALVISGWIPRY